MERMATSEQLLRQFHVSGRSDGARKVITTEVGDRRRGVAWGRSDRWGEETSPLRGCSGESAKGRVALIRFCSSNASGRARDSRTGPRKDDDQNAQNDVIPFGSGLGPVVEDEGGDNQPNA